MPGIFMFISGEAEGCVPGDGEGVGICIPGMFICICRGEGCGADCFGEDEGCAGMFIPGMLSIGVFFEGLFRAGVLLLLEGVPRRFFAGIFIPGMSIPGMLLISCFFAVGFFRVAFLLFRGGLGLTFVLFIPGMLCMSWPWATTMLVDVSIRQLAITTLDTEARKTVIRFDLSIISPF